MNTFRELILVSITQMRQHSQLFILPLNIKSHHTYSF